MALLVLLICVGLQHYMQLHQYGYQIHWFHYYYEWIIKAGASAIEIHGLLGVLMMVLPIIIIAGLIFSLACHMFGHYGEFIMSLVIVWFCIDGRDLRKHPYPVQDALTIFLTSYERLFAIAFWFIVFLYLGIMPALLIYPMLVSLRDYLQMHGSVYTQLYDWTRWLVGVFDWIPIRLTGLSFALVGHFRDVFVLWRQQLTTDISTDQHLIVQWGLAAIDSNVRLREQDIDSKSNIDADAGNIDAAIDIVDHAFILWLIVIAVFTLGLILGT